MNSLAIIPGGEVATNDAAAHRQILDPAEKKACF